MKKTLASFLVFSVFLIPSFAFAQTTPTSSTTYSPKYIQLLEELLSLLEQELAMLQAQQGTSPAQTVATPTSPVQITTQAGGAVNPELNEFFNSLPINNQQVTLLVDKVPEYTNSSYTNEGNGTFTFTFNATASGGSVYIPRALGSGSVSVTPSNANQVFSAITSSGTESAGGNIFIAAGQTVQLTVTASILSPTNGTYAMLNGLHYGASDAYPTSYYVLFPNTYQTTSININNSGNTSSTGTSNTGNTTLPSISATLPGNLTGVVNSPVSLSGKVTNQNAPTKNPFYDTYWFATDPAGKIIIGHKEFESGVPNGFPAGYSEVEPSSYTFTSPGTYYYQLCADEDQSTNMDVTVSDPGSLCTGWDSITISSATTGTQTTSGGTVVSTPTAGLQVSSQPIYASAVAALNSSAGTSQTGTFAISFTLTNTTAQSGSSESFYVSGIANPSSATLLNNGVVVSNPPLTCGITSNSGTRTSMNNFEIGPAQTVSLTYTCNLSGVSGSYSLMLNSLNYGFSDSAPATQTLTLPSTYQTSAVTLSS
jgi:hypothetical protein